MIEREVVLWRRGKWTVTLCVMTDGRQFIRASDGWTVYNPIMYDDGRIAFDRLPPQYVRQAVQRAYRRIRAGGAV